MKMYELQARLNFNLSRFFRSKSLRILEEKKLSGDAYASYLAGEVHILGGEKEQAIACWEYAAARGIADAQLALSNTYRKSDKKSDLAKAFGVTLAANENPNLGKVRAPYGANFLKIDLQKIIEQLRQIIPPENLIYLDSVRAETSAKADKGDPAANYQIGMFHYKGRPSEYGYIAPDDAAAKCYWERAAAAGHVQSQLILAYYGSERWLREAAINGHQGAQRELGHLLLDRAAAKHMACKPEGMRNYEWRKTPADPSLFAEAISWLRRAATSGCPYSAAQLASCYSGGFGVPADEKEDRAWTRTAIRNAVGSGFSVSDLLLELANRYLFGAGEPQSDADALRWYIAAAQQGSYKAMHTLGHLYARGQGVTKYLGEAANWFEQAEERRLQEEDFNPEYRTFDSDMSFGRYMSAACAFACSEAANGSRATLQIIDLVYEDSDTADQNETTAEKRWAGMSGIHETFHYDYTYIRRAETLEAVQKFAGEGIRSANFILGMSLFRSREKDKTDKGLVHLKAAAEQGVTLAMHLLGDLGHYPDKSGGVRPGDDAADALRWYERAAELGDTEAKFKLAFLAEKALAKPWEAAAERASSAAFEKPQEYIDTVAAYRELAEMGHARAQARLAGLLSGSSRMLESGRYHLGDDIVAQAEAEHWLRLAAEQGYATAAEALAETLQVAQSKAPFVNLEVIKWLRMAASAGSSSACGDLMIAYLFGDGPAQDPTEAMFWRRRRDALSRF